MQHVSSPVKPLAYSLLYFNAPLSRVRSAIVINGRYARVLLVLLPELFDGRLLTPSHDASDVPFKKLRARV
jgi:hypothetical protein